jgi:hypothetical protein
MPPLRRGPSQGHRAATAGRREAWATQIPPPRRPQPHLDPAPPASRHHWGVPRPPLQLHSAALIGRSKRTAEGKSGGGRASWCRCRPVPGITAAASRNADPPIAVILYHLFLGQARCASAHVTPAAPTAGSPPQRARPPGGSTWLTPEGGPAALPPRPGVQRCSRGLQAVPADQSGNGPCVCTPARGGASPKPPGAPRPHKGRTEAAPCVAERLPVQRRVYKGARDAPWCTVPLQPARHRRGAVKASSPGLPNVLCGSCHGAKRRTCPGACPGVPHRAVRHGRARHGA